MWWVIIIAIVGYVIYKYYSDKNKMLRRIVSGNYKCRFSVNRNASKSASLISDLQRNKIIKNDNFNDGFLL